jgi:hypothetical protein
MCFPGRRHSWKESIKVDRNVGFEVVDGFMWVRIEAT